MSIMDVFEIILVGYKVSFSSCSAIYFLTNFQCTNAFSNLGDSNDIQTSAEPTTVDSTPYSQRIITTRLHTIGMRRRAANHACRF